MVILVFSELMKLFSLLLWSLYFWWFAFKQKDYTKAFKSKQNAIHLNYLGLDTALPVLKVFSLIFTNLKKMYFIFKAFFHVENMLHARYEDVLGCLVDLSNH